MRRSPFLCTFFYTGNQVSTAGQESIPTTRCVYHLQKMSDSDLHLLGLSDDFARPEWMVLTVTHVPPPPVRPSIAMDGGAMRSEDDLTYKLGVIIKASANVRRCE